MTDDDGVVAIEAAAEASAREEALYELRAIEQQLGLRQYANALVHAHRLCGYLFRAYVSIVRRHL